MEKAARVMKSIFIFVIFFISFLAGIVPMKNKRFASSQHLLGIANTFSGGVFLAIAFVHIIPETASSYYIYILEKQTKKYFGMTPLVYNDNTASEFLSKQ